MCEHFYCIIGKNYSKLKGNIVANFCCAAAIFGIYLYLRENKCVVKCQSDSSESDA